MRILSAAAVLPFALATPSALPLLAALATLAAPVAPVAAQTFVVDVQNGPGTSFTSLAAAVAAVPSGAVLLVRPGSYGGFNVAGKGLRILADPGVQITGSIVIRDTRAGQGVALRALTWPSTAAIAGEALVQLDNCFAPVLLEDLTMAANAGCSPLSPPGQCMRPRGVYAFQCSRLVLRNCTIDCSASFVASDTVLESCTVTGEAAVPGRPDATGRGAVAVGSGRLQLAGGTVVRGGAGIAGVAEAGHGIGVVLADVRLIDADVAAGANGIVAQPAVLLVGPSGLRLTPRVVTSTPVSNVAVTPGPMPGLTGNTAPLGGQLQASVTTEPGDLVILGIGLPGVPLFVPDVDDPFWLHPVLHVPHSIGMQPASGPFTATIPVPNDPGLVGQRVIWQALCDGPATGLQVTNATIGQVR